MESIIETFHIDWKIIIAQAVNFGVVFTVLYVFALKPLSKMMAERSEKITKGIDDAKTNAELLKATGVKYEEAMARARVEANEVFQAGKKEAEHKKSLMLEDARNQVASLIKDGEKKLEAEKAKMLEEAKREMAILALATTEKVLGSTLDKSYNERMLKELENV